MGLLSWLRRSRYDELKEQLEQMRREINSELSAIRLALQEVRIRAEQANVNSEKAMGKAEELDEEMGLLLEKMDRVLKIARHGLQAKKDVEALKKMIESKNKGARSPSKPTAQMETEIRADVLSNLSRSEKAVLSVLLNSDMPLSYEDIARMLGKSESTVRDHIANIRKKTDIIEVIHSSERKKMFRIPIKVKNEILY